MKNSAQLGVSAPIGPPCLLPWTSYGKSLGTTSRRFCKPGLGVDRVRRIHRFAAAPPTDFPCCPLGHVSTSTSTSPLPTPLPPSRMRFSFRPVGALSPCRVQASPGDRVVWTVEDAGSEDVRRRAEALQKVIYRRPAVRRAMQATGMYCDEWRETGTGTGIGDRSHRLCKPALFFLCGWTRLFKLFFFAERKRPEYASKRTCPRFLLCVFRCCFVLFVFRGCACSHGASMPFVLEFTQRLQAAPRKPSSPRRPLSFFFVSPPPESLN